MICRLTKQDSKNLLLDFIYETRLNFQLDALKEAGCDASRIFSEKISGAKSERPRLNACLAQLKKDDTLLAWRLDRLGRSMPNLVGLVEDLR